MPPWDQDTDQEWEHKGRDDLEADTDEPLEDQEPSLGPRRAPVLAMNGQIETGSDTEWDRTAGENRFTCRRLDSPQHTQGHSKSHKPDGRVRRKVSRKHKERLDPIMERQSPDLGVIEHDFQPLKEAQIVPDTKLRGKRSKNRIRIGDEKAAPTRMLGHAPRSMTETTSD